MYRRTVIVEGPLALRMRRFAAARDGETGLQIMTLPLLAARLAGGFSRPAGPEDLAPAIGAALEAGGFADLEPIRVLPGMRRALLATLTKIWNADLSLQTLADKEDRIADLALIEERIHQALPEGALTLRLLRDRAIPRLEFAAAALGQVELDRVTQVAPVWRPLLDALAQHVSLEWRPAGVSDRPWFHGMVLRLPQTASAIPSVVSCANPQAEIIEAMRWVRELLATDRARPEHIAITAASPEGLDESVLALAASANLPIHFSHGIPALATADGQACAALADVLLRGLNQDRIRRLLGHVAGRGALIRDLRRDWARGIAAEAGLFEVEHWHRALAHAAALRPEGDDPTPLILAVLHLLNRGISAAKEAGEQLLGTAARRLWTDALRRAPPEAIEFSLEEIRVPDGGDPATSVVWCPASHLASAPRPWARLLALGERCWPRTETEDPLLPNHIVARTRLDPDPVTNRDRRAFVIIVAAANQGCVLSRSRRDAKGNPVPPSPLLRAFGRSTVTLRRSRVPAHAFNESDRLAARPQEAVSEPQIKATLQCWRNWHRPSVTVHDGRISASHPVIHRALAQPQSATSLRLLLRDPIAFVWRYALGWRPIVQEQQPLSLDARGFGQLVHAVLRHAVDALESDAGYGRAAVHEIEDAVALAATALETEWPIERSIPPLLLWQDTLAAAAKLALEALTLDERFRPGTRSWTELPFGETERKTAADLPWDPVTPVQIPGTEIRLRGTIDRLDLRAARDAVQVTDYKTGAEPKKPDRVLLDHGSEFQRVTYALAARQLLPDVSRVQARLIYLTAEPRPLPYILQDVDGAIAALGSHVTAACNLLEQGIALPGRDPDESEQQRAAGREIPPWASYDFRLALPAAAGTYFEIKRQSFSQALAPLARLWRSP